MGDEANGSLPPEVRDHYASGYEATRLAHGWSRLEAARTRELLARSLPPPPAVVLDIGGGPGAYALWLARRGYAVHLRDALPLHVALARQGAAEAGSALASAEVGDARALDVPDAFADAALLLGPLYHLTERADRLRALAEARRALRPGGVLLAVGVSRYASLLDGWRLGLFADPAFGPIVARDLAEGQHHNPTANPAYWTTAHLHRPEELAAEVAGAGFALEALLAVEGPTRAIPDLDAWWADADRRAQLLDLVRAVEAEPSLLGASAHLMTVARRPA